MTIAGLCRSTPAFLWRAFFVGALVSVPLAAGPSTNSNPSDTVVGTLPSQEQGKSFLTQFRDSGPARPYYLEFDLHQLPRRGEEQIVHGRYWASRNDQGNVLRIELNPGKAPRHFLVQNGPNAAVWLCDLGAASSAPVKVSATDAMVAGFEITPFDLQMPFFYWPDEQLVGVYRIRSRPADQFIFKPPQAFAAANPDVTAVRSFLDTEFHVPVQTELLNKDGVPSKTVALVDIKKIGDQWMFKDIDVRNESTRDRTRISITAAAMNAEISPSIFDPATLDKPADPPAAGQLIRIEP